MAYAQEIVDLDRETRLKHTHQAQRAQLNAQQELERRNIPTLFTLSLNRDEVETLVLILQHVGGDPKGRCGDADRMRLALGVLGFTPTYMQDVVPSRIVFTVERTPVSRVRPVLSEQCCTTSQGAAGGYCEVSAQIPNQGQKGQRY